MVFLNIHDTTWGKWPIRQGDIAHMTVKPDHLTIDECSLQTPNAALRFHGEGQLAGAAAYANRSMFSSKAMAGYEVDARSSDAWDIPFGLSGQMDSRRPRLDGDTRASGR